MALRSGGRRTVPHELRPAVPARQRVGGGVADSEAIARAVLPSPVSREERAPARPATVAVERHAGPVSRVALLRAAGLRLGRVRGGAVNLLATDDAPWPASPPGCAGTGYRTVAPSLGRIDAHEVATVLAHQRLLAPPRGGRAGARAEGPACSAYGLAAPLAGRPDPPGAVCTGPGAVPCPGPRAALEGRRAHGARPGVRHGHSEGCRTCARCTPGRAVGRSAPCFPRRAPAVQRGRSRRLSPGGPGKLRTDRAAGGRARPRRPRRTSPPPRGAERAPCWYGTFGRASEPTSLWRQRSLGSGTSLEQRVRGGRRMKRRAGRGRLRPTRQGSSDYPRRTSTASVPARAASTRTRSSRSSRIAVARSSARRAAWRTSSALSSGETARV